MDIELINDNTIKTAPKCPTISYELVVDMGDNGTKTIYSSNLLSDILKTIEELKTENFLKVDFTESELQDAIGFSIYVTLTTEYELMAYIIQNKE